MGLFAEFTMGSLDFLAVLFVVIIGVVALIAAILFIIDVSQTKDAIRRNYPVIGRFRYIFSTLGEFFRQYFFAMDREEMPFNRAEREWVYKSSEGADNTVAFGSTRNLNPVGTPDLRQLPLPAPGRRGRRRPRAHHRTPCPFSLMRRGPSSTYPA